MVEPLGGDEERLEMGHELLEGAKSLDAKGRCWAIGTATIGLATLRPRKMPTIVFGLAVALLASNPALDAPSAMTADYLFETGLAGSKRSAASALAAAPNQFHIRDFNLLTVVTCAETDTWTAPVLAIGFANTWSPLGKVTARGDSLQIEAPIAPVYLAPVFLAAAAWVALLSFDAPASSAV